MGFLHQFPRSGTIKMIWTILMLILLVNCKTVVPGRVYQHFIERKLTDSVLYDQATDESSTCLCRIVCAKTPECTAFSIVFQENGMFSCFYSNYSVLNWENTEPNTSAITFIKHAVMGAELMDDQERAEFGDSTSGVSTSFSSETTSGASNSRTPTTNMTTLTSESTNMTTLTSESLVSTSATVTPITTSSDTTVTSTESTMTTTTSATTNETAECVRPFQIWPCIGCFHVSSERSTWEVSKTSCENLNSSLYVAKSEEEFRRLCHHLHNPLSPYNIYVGVKDRCWTDGRKVTEWALQEPKHTDTACGKMERRSWEYKLVDCKCSEEYRYICEKELTTSIADGCTADDQEENDPETSWQE